MERKRRRQRFIYRTPMFYCISACIFSVCTLLSTVGSRTVCLDNITPPVRKADNSYFQVPKNSNEKKEEQEEIISRSSTSSRNKMGLTSLSLNRRYLKGLGSSPPRCASKCGKCTPCKPVHVPVPPGTPVKMEYYPEAWRCKCGNKLYMP